MPPALVIFDWAGTLVDFGCRAPLVAFLDAFAAAGVPIDEATARRPMGAHKRDHAREILGFPAVAAAVRAKFGRDPGEALLDDIYARFGVRLAEILPGYAVPVPGAIDTLRWLRDRGIRIGSTTGYTRSMMLVLEPAAAAAGLRTDALVCADEVPAARPAPWACRRLAERFDVRDPARCIKIGDTPADVAEGLNAGMISLAVSATGNEVGLAHAALAALPESERAGLVAAAAARLRAAGAHDVLPGVAALPGWIEQRSETRSRV
jgi:phosphonoacetaldehyde hydrolase